MRLRRFAPVLLAALLLLCAACSPMAEVSPASTPVPSPSAEPTQAATPTPEPTPEPSPHDWAGSGYSYTSEKLGITLEFPPEWAELMTISECEQGEGFVRGDPGPVDCIRLRPIHGWDTDDGMSEDAVALIYWRYPDQRGPEAEYGDAVILGERDGKLCVCFLKTNNKLNFVQEEDPVIWNEYVTVEQGILNGEYEVKLLD